jgi:hypothetical protein
VELPQCGRRNIALQYMALQQWGISPGVALSPGLEILINAAPAFNSHSHACVHMLEFSLKVA